MLLVACRRAFPPRLLARHLAATNVSSSAVCYTITWKLADSAPAQRGQLASFGTATTQQPVRFTDIGIPQSVAYSMAAAGILTPSSIQTSAIPAILAGDDVSITAETGSGKTIAYFTPIAAKLLEPGSVGTAVVLLPSVELVQQVAEVIKLLWPALAPVTFTAYGSMAPVKSDNVRVLIGTPQAIKENVRAVHLEKIRWVVLDEADSLVSGSHLPFVEALLSTWKMRLAGSRPQFVFCAATMPSGGKKSVFAWVTKYFPDMKHVSSPGLHRLPLSVTQTFVRVSIPATIRDSGSPDDVGEADLKARTHGLIRALRTPIPALGAAKETHTLEEKCALTQLPPQRIQVPQKTMVFVNAVDRVSQVTKRLLAVDKQLSVVGLSKQLELTSRAKAVSSFVTGDTQVLVCTDIAARGLDTRSVQHVVQFDFAQDAVSYLHRAGRTGRFGQHGHVTCLYGEESEDLATAVFEAGHDTLQDCFSRGRSFRRKIKKAAAAAADADEHTESTPTQ